MDEGYGVSREAIDSLKAEGVSLIITVDCGITACDEADYAKSLGIDMVITDHHACKEELPKAVAVVDPHRKDCPYPFKELAGVGVALKLVLAMEGPERTRQVLDTYADLAAVGTVADVMKLLGENRALVHLGLEQLKKTQRPGLSALMTEAGTNAPSLTATTVGFCLAPRINAAGRMGKAQIAAELILTQQEDTARNLSRELCDLNRERQAVELEIFNQCTAQLDQMPRVDSVVLADEAWHQGVVGIVASRLSERYACPAFMICLQEGKGKGSCRSYGGFNLFEALERCQDLLEGYGGHALAAGFTILEENIPAFRERMDALVAEKTGGEELVSTLEIDARIDDVSLLTVEEVEKLSMLEPYGNGNPKPIFSLLGATVTYMSDVGGGRHLKMRVALDGRNLEVIFFSMTKTQTGLRVGDKVDLAFYPQINEYRGSRSVQLHMVDLEKVSVEETEEELFTRFMQGDTLHPLGADHLLPRREEFVTLWRYLKQCGGKVEGTLEGLAKSVAALGIRESAVCVQLCLEVLAECGLVQMERVDQRLRVQSRAQAGQKMDLEKAPLMVRLRSMARGI